MISKSIFKAYDIRGIINETLNEDVAYQIGCAFGSEVIANGGDAVVIGRDGRLSGPMLIESLSKGLCSAGVDVVDIGMIATPMGYFATHVPLNIDDKNSQPRLIDSCIVVTGSHNPPNYNGFKIVLRGNAIYGDAIQVLYQRIMKKEFSIAKNDKGNNLGSHNKYDITKQYIERIVSDITLTRPMKIIIDCGNGVAGAFAPTLFKALGCDVRELYCEVDGHFPNHHPDPADPNNLQDLIEALAKTDAEIGLAFDGDGDRLGVVTKGGDIIYPDRQLMLFAKEVLTRHAGAQIIFDVKCTQHLKPWIQKHGGQPLMSRTGHSLIKAKLKETGAPLAGEMSGHIFFKDRWYGFDDGLYTGARLLEILSQTNDPSVLLNHLPHSLSTPELQLKCEEGENFELIEQLQKNAKFEGAKEVITIDGLRVEYADGFGLARASNTTPTIVMRFEADNEIALKRIQNVFKLAIEMEKPNVKLPF